MQKTISNPSKLKEIEYFHDDGNQFIDVQQIIQHLSPLIILLDLLDSDVALNFHYKFTEMRTLGLRNTGISFTEFNLFNQLK